MAITTIIGLFIDYNRRLKENKSNIDKQAEAQRKQKKELDDYKKSLRDISKQTSDNAKKELSELKQIYKAATDETKSKKERIKAANALIRLYPEHFSQMNIELILLGKAKTAYENLSNSIIKNAKARAAYAKIEENQGQIIELELARDKKRKELEGIRDEGIKSIVPGALSTKSSHNAQYEYVDKNGQWRYRTDIENIKEEWEKRISSKLQTFENKITLLEKANEDLSKFTDTNTFIESEYTNNNDKGDTDRNNIIKEWREKEEAINKMAYYTGQQTYEEYCTKKNEILIEYYDKLLADTSLKESERLKIEAERAEELHKQQTAADKATLDEKLKALEQQKKEEEDAIVNAYISRDKIEKADEQRLREQLFQINQDYLNKKKGLYVEYGKNEEAAKIEDNLEKQSLDEKLRKHKEYIRLLDSMRRQYDKLSIEEREAAELLTIDALYQQKLISEEEYQQKKKAIEEKYKGEERKEAYEVSDGGGWGDKTKEMYFSISDLIDSVTEKGKLSFEDIGKAAESAWAVAGSALQIYSNYAQAEADLEVARIENKYDQQIKAAGKNDKKVKQLEEQRDREIAKAKSKANKKAMKIEIAQAVAQTAMAAINAYASAAAIPVVGYILGPIAAAMATAAGMMQIATIRKQHQVQEAGYYSGGFTKKSLNNHEVVGVVHANEFVANASATANPALAPVFSLFDYAQRNNTIGSLTPEDVSHALGTGAVVQATKTTAQESRQNSGELLAVAGSLTGNNEVIRRLNEKLDEGIDAFVILDGERGFELKYSHYLKVLPISNL